MGEWVTSSSSSWELMEMAKEELDILRSQHPNKFEYLKSELNSFISLLRDLHAPPSLAAASDLVLTQASSNRDKKQSKKKRKSKETCNNNNVKYSKMATKRKDRVDVALEKAQLCLQKLRDVKSSLC